MVLKVGGIIAYFLQPQKSRNTFQYCTRTSIRTLYLRFTGVVRVEGLTVAGSHNYTSIYTTSRQAYRGALTHTCSSIAIPWSTTFVRSANKTSVGRVGIITCINETASGTCCSKEAYVSCSCENGAPPFEDWPRFWLQYNCRKGSRIGRTSRRSFMYIEELPAKFVTKECSYSCIRKFVGQAPARAPS